MSSKDIAVSVRGVSKSYTIAHNAPKHTMVGEALMHRFKNPLHRPTKETFWALQDIEFDIEKGDVIGVIGRNGAGKSTLLKILSRITKPTTGQIDLYGRVGSLLEVGTGFHPELTGRENIFLNGAILGMRKREIERQFDAIVEFAEVERFLDTPVKRYSSGMYVRLAFAVAAHLNLEILIVDEVLAVGDAEFQKKCLGRMGDVAKGGKTVLFVSHNMSIIQQLCQKGVLLRSGRIHTQGSVRHVIDEYVSDSKNAPDGMFDFSAHDARPKKYQPLIRSLQMGTSGNPTTSIFDPQDDLILTLDVDPKSVIKKPRIAIAIEDFIGRRITTTASYFGQTKMADIEGPSKIRCVIPRINLGSGRYMVSVSIADEYGKLLDSLDNAAWFEVGWKNSYGNGEPFLQLYGPVLINSSWEKID